jgi:hypothetical protein
MRLLLIVFLSGGLNYAADFRTDVALYAGVLKPVLDVSRLQDRHVAFTGAVRRRIGERWAAQGEMTVLTASNGNKETGGGLYVLRWLRQDNRSRVQPYAMFGIDVFHAFAPLRNSSTGPLAGVGTKIYLADRIFLHAEGRIWTTLRYAAGFGFSWGRR